MNHLTICFVMLYMVHYSLRLTDWTGLASRSVGQSVGRSVGCAVSHLFPAAAMEPAMEAYLLSFRFQAQGDGWQASSRLAKGAGGPGRRRRRGAIVCIVISVFSFYMYCFEAMCARFAKIRPIRSLCMVA